ncbi:MAG: hypothetical protein JW773_01855 [Desulfuromonadales bacterium]|nr:hypothetical protein [Desulfuromonadales bacterium]MBN2645030.1 hypothetical protein [Desulfuromonadaceae bacterium]
MNHTDMMNHTGGWMDGFMVPETWVWPVVGVLLVVLLTLAIFKLVKK